jgi:hypothetical protein
MADKKVSALTAATTLASTDLAHVITSVATTPTNEKVTLANVFNKNPSFYGYSGTGIQAYTSASSALTVTGGLVLVTTPSTATSPEVADGVAGQTVTFVHDVAGGGASIVTPDTLSGGASISLTDVGDSFSMVYTATRGWVVTDESSGVAPVSTSLILTKA